MEPEGPLASIAYNAEIGSLRLLDQRLIPHKEEYLDVKTCEEGWKMINTMVVRGAPAIAITGALSLAVELRHCTDPPSTAEQAVELVKQRLDYLVTSRPTAVNLAIAAQHLAGQAAKTGESEGASPEDVFLRVISEAERMLEDDRAANMSIGNFGARAIREATRARCETGAGLRVLTHCNTGSLATAGYGTALGVIRSLHQQGALAMAFCTETRPYNQGARLTAYELVRDGIPATLVTDSAACYLVSVRGCDAVVVGADRIAANGDVANKIGTFALAAAARQAGVPFFVAAPTTTIDLQLPSGAGIPIEERAAREVTHSREGARQVVEGIAVWNPAFDVAPAPLVAGIVTERGTAVPDASGCYDLAAFLACRGKGETGGLEGAEVRERGIGAARCLTEAELRDEIERDVDLAAAMGGTRQDWSITEIGDGNINFVFAVQGPSGGVIVKQALPYVRCIGEAMPLTTGRAEFEADALARQHDMCPAHVPRVFRFDKRLSAIFMQYLEPPNVILRWGLVAGEVYPKLADWMSTFLAHTLFKSSLLNLPSCEYRRNVSLYAGNDAMCALTEQVVFTDPYGPADLNRWSKPYLDAQVEALWQDVAAKEAACELKRRFCEHAEALIHGDLHTGSVMVTQESLHVIDPEFAFYGPMGFDIGAFLANLLLAFFASDGLEAAPGERQEQRRWLASCARDLWNQFEDKFRRLWNESGERNTAYPAQLFGADGDLQVCQDAFMASLFQDTVGFAGAKIIRRIVGVAHVADMEEIADPKRRAECEGRALSLGKRLLVGRKGFEGIEEVVEAAVQAREAPGS